MFEVRVLRTTLLLVLIVLLQFITACGGGTTSSSSPSSHEPIIGDFTLSKAIITLGSGATLTAQFSNGEGSIDHGIGKVVSNTPIPITPGADTTYTLTVTGAGVTKTKTVSIQVVEMPAISEFKCSASAIRVGADTSLSATFTGGTGSIDPEVGIVASGQVMMVNPSASTSYKLTVTNLAGDSVSRSLDIQVIPAPIILGFSALPILVSSGSRSTLQATYANGTGTIDHGLGAIPSGGLGLNTEPLTTATTFKLRVVNVLGDAVEQSVSIDVVPLPHITSFTASAAHLPFGGVATLTAEFENGKGSLNHNIGTIPSGATLSTGALPHTVNYALTVRNAAGDIAFASLTIQVDAITLGASSFTGSMTIGRMNHTQTLLDDGRVLIAGGNISPSQLSSAELFDPATGLCTATGSLSEIRIGHTATRLKDGRILIVGGSDRSPKTEIFDPSTGKFAFSGSLAENRSYHSAILLKDGRVLILGGSTSDTQATRVEVFDPATGTFTTGGSLGGGRFGHTATLLADGKVFIAGGSDPLSFFTTTEIFDPQTGVSTPGPALINARSGHTATLLPSGKVLLVGGCVLGATAELYDPATGTCSATGSMALHRTGHQALLLANGTVLVVGGNTARQPLVFNEIYYPSSGTFVSAGSLQERAFDRTSTLLADGRVLVTGGNNSFTTVSTAEVFDPTQIITPHAFAGAGLLARIWGTGTLTPLPGGDVLLLGGYLGPAQSGTLQAGIYRWQTGTFELLATSPSYVRYHTSTMLTDGTVLIAGGQTQYYNDQLSTFLYDPKSDTYSATGSLNYARTGHTATRLLNGKILIAGGGSLTAELYDPATGKFTPTGALHDSRSSHTATLLPCGKVLLAGGYLSSSVLASCEIYDPATGQFTQTGYLAEERMLHTATLLQDGTVLVAGGENASGTSTTSSEHYDPASGKWQASGSMAQPRFGFTSTLMTDGTVLVIGGLSASGVNSQVTYNTSERYDPTTGLFTPCASMTARRAGHNSALLPDGTVFVIGGVDYMDENEISTELFE